MGDKSSTTPPTLGTPCGNHPLAELAKPRVHPWGLTTEDRLRNRTQRAGIGRRDQRARSDAGPSTEMQ